MESTSRIERWAWLGFFLLALALLTPPGLLVGLALWFWVRWKKGARTRWFVLGGLAAAGWVGLAFLLDEVSGQIIQLRMHVLMVSDLGIVMQSFFPLWLEGLLLAPTIACLTELFHPATSLTIPLLSQPRSRQPQLRADPLSHQELLQPSAPEEPSPQPMAEAENEACDASSAPAIEEEEPPTQASA